jgi:hypothetical protein
MVASSIIVNDLIQVLPNPYALTITPRLEYSLYLANKITPKLQTQLNAIREANSKFYIKNEDLVAKNSEFRNQVRLEANLDCAIEIIRMVQNRLYLTTRLAEIHEILPLVSLIRMANSMIYTIHDSYDFVELSCTLGSIVIDSGSLVDATYDFKQANLESKHILAEVNLIVESKINKQYPNLNF